MSKNTEKYRTKIGGMSCSFCSQSIEKAYNRTEGVKNANVTISHEEALVECDSSEISSQEPEKILLGLGYSVRDPDKVLSFGEEEALREKRRLLYIAGGFTLFTVGAR